MNIIKPDPKIAAERDRRIQERLDVLVDLPNEEHRAWLLQRGITPKPEQEAYQRARQEVTHWMTHELAEAYFHQWRMKREAPL